MLFERLLKNATKLKYTQCCSRAGGQAVQPETGTAPTLDQSESSKRIT